MESFGAGIYKIMAQIFESAGDCPECGAMMLRPKRRHKDGTPIPGACPACGYKMPLAKGEKHQPTQADLEFQSHKRTAIAYFGNYSVMATKLPSTARLKNYEVKTEAQNKAREFARSVSELIINKSPQHVMLTGPTGVGKTHLASGILWQCLMLKKYEYKAIFIDFQEYTKQTVIGYHKTDIGDQMTNVVSEAKKADLVVIDDIGAERDTPNNADLLAELLRAREDKNLIITTNLDSQGIQGAYGDRNLSRILNHLNNNDLTMSGMLDYRARKD